MTTRSGTAFTRRVQFALKSVGDRLAAAVLLLVSGPLIALIAIAIIIDDGRPVFFRQKRVGRFARLFRIWKFRSMFVDADDRLAEDGSVVGNRITRVGRLLRFSSLDELPQLINILSGDMSFVGPRPSLPEHVDRYTQRQRRRLEVRPGVTGLAQVEGRNTLPWSRRIELDIYYIDNFSLWMDMVILGRTVRVWLFRDGIVADRNPEQVDDLANPSSARSDSE